MTTCNHTTNQNSNFSHHKSEFKCITPQIEVLFVVPKTIVSSLKLISFISFGFPWYTFFSKSYQWFSSSGNCTNSSSTRNTISLIGHRSTFWESSDASPSFSFTLQFTPVEWGSVSTILVIGHLFLVQSSLGKTISPTLKLSFWFFHLSYL